MAGEFERIGGVLAKLFGVRTDGQSQQLNVDDSGRLKTLAEALLVSADADITQLITVAVAGGTPAVQGPDKSNPGGWILKADPNNTGSVWFFFHGQTKDLKGFPLGIGEAAFVMVENLSSLDFDADANGAKIHALKV
jgi:hypothetical protein